MRRLLELAYSVTLTFGFIVALVLIGQGIVDSLG